MSGHFEYQDMSLGGLPIGEMVLVKTATGLILQAHPRMDSLAIQHMAAMARSNPDYPYDLALWSGPDNDRAMVWTARIYWRE